MGLNISSNIRKFDDESKNMQHRYYSFDFCYSHFRQSKESGNIDIEKSCQVLWSYLASWGMLRGSSFLLWKNPAYFKELVEFIYAQPISIWQIDVQSYNTKSAEIIQLYYAIKERVILDGKNNRHITLITKILLGVFAIVPAYDRFFAKTFSEISRICRTRETCGFSSFNQKSLDVIYQFYIENKEEIDKLSKEHKIVDFYGQKTKYCYSAAKIIDMYGFQASRK